MNVVYLHTMAFPRKCYNSTFGNYPIDGLHTCKMTYRVTYCKKKKKLTEDRKQTILKRSGKI